jgi:hypothetical protein
VARVHGLVPASACSPNQVLHLTRPASALPGLHSLPVRAGQVTTVAAIRWCCSTARS